MKNLPQKIRRLRELQNLSQEYLADRLGITRQTYGKIEAGRTGLSIDQLDKIASTLGCPAEAILTLTAEETYMQFLYKPG